MLMDILSQLGRRDKMLKNEQDISSRGVERFIPLLRSDGVLHLSNLIIDGEYTERLLDFLSALRIHPILQKSVVRKVIIDNVKIEQQDLLRLLESFETAKTSALYESKSSFSQYDSVEDPHQDMSARQPNTAATNIVALTLSNIELTSDLL